MPNAAPAQPPGRDAAARNAPGARLRRSAGPPLSRPISRNRTWCVGGRRRSLCSVGVRSTRTNRPLLLLRLLTCLSGQFFLLSGLMVIWFGHELSGDESVEGWPPRRYPGRTWQQVCALAGRNRCVFVSYYARQTTLSLFTSTSPTARQSQHRGCGPVFQPTPSVNSDKAPSAPANPARRGPGRRAVRANTEPNKIRPGSTAAGIARLPAHFASVWAVCNIQEGAAVRRARAG